MEADSFLEKFAWYIRTMSTYDEVPDEEHNDYFKRLFEASDRKNISEDKLSIYDKIVRDEIQIKAELYFAVEQAEAKGKAIDVSGPGGEVCSTVWEGHEIKEVSPCVGLTSLHNIYRNDYSAATFPTFSTVTSKIRVEYGSIP